MALSEEDTKRMFPETLRFDSDDDYEIGHTLTHKFAGYTTVYEIREKEPMGVTRFHHYICRRIRNVEKGDNNA